MYITRKHITRRTALRGLGVTLALPWLEAMMPAQTPIRGSAAQPRTRFAALEMVHGSAGSTGEGTRLHYWSPKTVGRDFDTTPILRSLQPYQDYVTIVSHTDIAPATAQTEAEAGADHTRSSAAFLTSAHAKMTEGADIANGISREHIRTRGSPSEAYLPSSSRLLESRCWWSGHRLRHAARFQTTQPGAPAHRRSTSRASAASPAEGRGSLTKD